MLSVLRTASSAIIVMAAFAGLLQRPLTTTTIQSPHQHADNLAPAAPIEPDITAVVVSAKNVCAPKKAEAKAKACPCSNQCTCGCQSGKACRCSQQVKTPPPPIRQQTSPATLTNSPAPMQVLTATTKNREWVLNGRSWTRQSLLDHLYHHANHRHARGSLDHLAIEQLQAIHNSEHEQQSKPMGFIQPVAQPTIFVGNNCPNGQCPSRPMIRQTFSQPFVGMRNCPNGQCPIR